MLEDGGWGPRLFFETVPKCSARFSYVFFGAFYMWAVKFVDYPNNNTMVNTVDDITDKIFKLEKTLA